MNIITKSVLVSLAILLSLSNIIHAQKSVVDIKFEIENYDNDTLVLGYYYGDRTLVQDTLFADKPGQFRYKQDTLLKPGVYIALYQTNKKFFQFLVNETDQKFKLLADYTKSAVKAKGSKDNELFNNYMAFIGEKTKERSKLIALRDTLKKQNKAIDSQTKALEKLDQDVQKELNSILEKHPNTITAILLRSGKQIDIPEFTGTKDEIQVKKYRHFKSHYFDHIDLANPAVLRTPFIHERVDYYIEKLTPQHPDSIFTSIQYLLKKMEPAEESFKFYTSTFLNKYANSNIIGFDAIYVKIVDEYYAKGKAPWVTKEMLNKFMDNAAKLRPILLGEPAPDITLFKEDGSPLRIYDIESDFTIVAFWAPDCGHCKKSMPAMIEFYNKFKSKGVELVGVCTKHRDKTQSCWDYINENKLPWISVADQYHRSRFRDKYNVVSTPRVFILDKDKKILLKRVPTDKLGDIMQDLIQDLEKKKNKDIKE